MSEHASAAGQHQHGLHQHLAPVVERKPFAGGRDARRQRIAQPQTVRKGEGVQADVRYDLLPATFHLHADHAVSVHLASALLARVSDASTTSGSLDWRALPRMGDPQLTRPGE